MHNHCRVEKLPDEILAAFRANDRQHSGTIHSKHLKHLLLGWGEHLSNREGIVLYICNTYLHELYRVCNYFNLIKLLYF